MFKRTSNTSANTDGESIQVIIQKLQDLIEEGIIKYIEENFRRLNNTVKNFEDFENIVRYNRDLINIVDTLIAKCLNVTQSTEEGDDSSDKLCFLLTNLKDRYNNVAYLRMINFMQDILNNLNKKEILFNNLVLTEEEINKRYRRLALYFHPDKTISLPIPTALKEKYKELGAKLFKYILEFRNSLLFDLKQSSKIGHLSIHEEKANESWKIAIDYRNASKAHWDKLKLLKEEDLRMISSEQLKSFSISHAHDAYNEYRAACKLADKDKQLRSQVKLRGYMALSLFICDKFLEAQLCAISAINLIYRNPNDITRQDLFEAKQIFDKVKSSNFSKNGNSTQLNTEIKPKYNPDNPCYALVKSQSFSDDYSFFERKSIHRSIIEDLEKLSIELMLKADRNLVSYKADEKEILMAKTHAYAYKAVGAGTMVAAGGAGGITVAAGGYSSLNAFLVGTGIGGPAVGVVAGISMLVFGLWGGRHLWKKGTQLLKEPETREVLNQIMEKALHAYDQGDYNTFFDELSKNYESGNSLLKLKNRGDFVDHQKIIKELIMHGFRPDGIAYLLNLIGEALISGRIKIDGITTEELKLNGMNVLNGVLSTHLEDEARKLDNRVNEKRRKTMKFYFYFFTDLFLIKDYSRIALKSDFEDVNEMPFTSKLEEMRNTAMINIAIYDVLNGSSENIELAKNLIEKVRMSIESSYQYSHKAKIRLEILEDFLWIVSGVESEKMEFPEVTY